MADYAFDPDFAPIIELLPAELADLSDPEAIAALRDMGGLEQLLGDGPEIAGVESEDRAIVGPEGGPDVPIRIYRPTTAAPASGRGALVYIHGGGFMFGSIELTDQGCRAYCAGADIVVVSVDYRLAPEDPYPAGLEDCYAALEWVAENSDALGVDATRVGVGGASAGGGLAAATALAARDRDGPALCFQFLQIPELDDRLATPSMMQFTDTPLWNRPNAVWSWTHYLGPLHGADEIPYLAAPARCDDLSGLPPAYVSTMEFDPLRDEGILYALGLLQAGVAVELHSFPGTFHGSALITHAAVSQREAAESVTALRKAFAPASS